MMSSIDDHSNRVNAQPKRRAARDDANPRHKRQRVTRACNHCKRRKRRCTGDVPCTYCLRENQECTYLATYTRGKRHTPPRSDFANDAGHSLGPRPLTVTVQDGYVTTFVGQYVGPSSSHAFFRRAWQRFGRQDDQFRAARNDVQVKQTSILHYGDRPSPDVVASLAGFPLPARSAHLLSWYFEIGAPTYRFLHFPTIQGWLSEFHDLLASRPSSIATSKARQAIVLLVMAVAQLYELDTSRLDTQQMFAAWLEIESMYVAAKQRLDEETGRATSQSVQARLTMVQYLLSTSRPNQAWYTFGQAVQLMFALGMHRNMANIGSESDLIKQESRKRAFWVAYIIDTYLSSMLGRPPMIRDDDTDQELPLMVDDEDLTASSAMQPVNKDSTMLAVIRHIQLTRIAKRILLTQALGCSSVTAETFDTAIRFDQEVREWHEALPVYLSGAIRGSSLMPIFRRQASVLKRAYAHAQMLINRRFILSESRGAFNTAPLIDTCLAAAKSCLDVVLEFVHEGNMFSAFWNTHFVTFSALSVIYIWIIQRRCERLPASREAPDEMALFERAETVRGYLTDVTQHSAPSLRYAAVLEELYQEARLRLGKQLASTPESNETLQGQAIVDASPQQDNLPTSIGDDLDRLAAAFPLDPNLWLELDAFPFNEIFE